jgi:sugar/nucleoside kinase (ribokinase family)
LPVDFVAVGHMTQDRIGDSFRPGGAVSYAAVAACRLGRRPGILTRANLPGIGGKEARTLTLETAGAVYGALSGIPVRVLPSSVSTVFQNIYDGEGRRVQAIESLAGQIAPEELPADWALAPVFLLGPVANELPAAWAAALSPCALLGIAAQGWLRAWDQAGQIRPTHWEGAQPFLERADAVIFSSEDVDGDEGYVAELAAHTRLLVVTEGRAGCTVYLGGAAHPVEPRPAREVDPTGAGDVFAAAFLVRLAETGSPLAAAGFANVAASMSVEAQGMAAIPYRRQVEDWISS